VPNPNAVVARIGEHRVITAGQYGTALLSRWSGVRNIEAARASAPIVLQKTIEEELLLAEAEKRGYADRVDIRNAVRRRENQFLAPRYLREVVAEGIQATPEEMKAYFEENRERFRKPPQVHLSQITVATEDEANSIAGLLTEGADVAWLARKHSTDRFRDAGGYRGWVAVRPGADPVSQQMAEAEPGGVVGPIGVEGNYVVFVVSARKEQGLYSYEEVSGNVRQEVEAGKFEVVLEEFMNVLRERAEIRLNEEVLASLNFTGSVEEAGSAGGEHGGHDH
jgi:parvulin-like peptidyl-prolyl isomerase